MPLLGSIAVPRVVARDTAPFQGPACPRIYWRGDLAQVVGGEGDHYTYRLLEGHRKGECVLVSPLNALIGQG